MAWNKLPMNEESDFWEQCIPEPNTGCWLWVGTVRRNPCDERGVFSYRGKHWQAHRLAFLFANGRAPELQVNHTCDVSLCMNPAHLYEGTQLDNMRDRLRRKRWTGNKGEAAHHKLVTAQILEIRSRAAAGESQKALATEFGVVTTTVNRIANGKRWGHLLLCGGG